MKFSVARTKYEHPLPIVEPMDNIQISISHHKVWSVKEEISITWKHFTAIVPLHQTKQGNKYEEIKQPCEEILGVLVLNPSPSLTEFVLNVFVMKRWSC